MERSGSSSPSLYSGNDNVSNHYDSVIGEKQHRMGLNATNGEPGSNSTDIDHIINGLSNSLSI